MEQGKFYYVTGGDNLCPYWEQQGFVVNSQQYNSGEEEALQLILTS